MTEPSVMDTVPKGENFESGQTKKSDEGSTGDVTESPILEIDARKASCQFWSRRCGMLRESDDGPGYLWWQCYGWRCRDDITGDPRMEKADRMEELPWERRNV